MSKRAPEVRSLAFGDIGRRPFQDRLGMVVSEFVQHDSLPSNRGLNHGSAVKCATAGVISAIV
jgi:hypothetical protein